MRYSGLIHHTLAGLGALVALLIVVSAPSPAFANAPAGDAVAHTASGKVAPTATATDKHGESTKEEHGEAATEEHGESTKEEPAAWWVVFFVLLLLSIALFPLVNEHWWESNVHKGYIAAGLSVPVLIYYLSHGTPGIHEVVDHLLEYFSFIVLLWALYTISGGIVLRGDIAATPKTNVIFLAVGAVLANIFGTTGAAMLLIRPLLNTNAERKNKTHIVIFFIFIVANVGGSLTPLGDPPLFLGYLAGVPFEWTLRLWPIWLPTVLFLLTIFYIWDVRAYRKERPEDVKLDQTNIEPLRLEGTLNFLFIGGVVAATLLSKNFTEMSSSMGLLDNEHSMFHAFLVSGSPWREILMILMGILSMVFTKKALRKANDFNFHAIIEVAVLFIGIFITMIPALELLAAHGSELGLTEPWQYMWATGILSSFLDNAPTYLVFATTGSSFVGAGGDIAALVTQGPVFLMAISVGAVFMGANTYIGNAPNFMVKVIADTAGTKRVQMPSFFSYMKWSVGILVPTYILVALFAFVIFQ